MVNPSASSQRQVTISKLLLMVVALLAAYTASFRSGDILSMVSAAFSLAASAFFPPLVIGVFWKRANQAGAVAGMIAGFLENQGDALEYRLMRAVEGGRDAGGQGTADAHRPERSAAIKVVDRRDYPDVDVRVDVHPTAVAELRRVLEEFKAYETFYRGRDTDPAKAIPQDVFVKELEARRRARA